tara:strand:+ start:115 stop:492 length:378 start_codon:yes stop_codon:yes gene_type:complete
MKFIYILLLLISSLLALSCETTNNQDFNIKIIDEDLNKTKNKIINLNNSLNLNYKNTNESKLFFVSDNYTILDGYNYYDLYEYSLEYLERNKTLIELIIYRVNADTLEKKLIIDDSISYKNHLSL